MINPLSIKSFAKSRLSKNKTDEADIIIIAKYIAIMLENLIRQIKGT
ncbi:hypothetical protein [Rickettsiales endosymbiont of Trichoplax sp. H2]